MIGRLVEKKNVGRWCERACQRGAACLAAGQMRRIFLSGEAQLIQKIAGKMGIVARRETAFDVGERRGEAGKIGLLRQVANNRARLHENGAAVRCDVSGGDLEQGRLARAVAADEGNPFAGRD
jgi:hypothetical protein